MKSYEHHFIDSNVIIGFIIGWDNLRDDSINYFSLTGFKRYASEHVFNECVEVLAKNKIWIKKFVYHLIKHCEKKSLIRFNHELNNIRKSVVKKLSIQYQREHKKIDGVIRQFVKVNHVFMIDVMKGNIKGEYLLKMIDSAFLKARRNLLKVFKFAIDKKIVPSNILNTLFTTYRTLQKEKELHNKDILILLDSHYISTKYARTMMAFITFDNGIIKSKKIIEGQLGIKIFKPS